MRAHASLPPARLAAAASPPFIRHARAVLFRRPRCAPVLCGLLFRQPAMLSEVAADASSLLCATMMRATRGDAF